MATEKRAAKATSEASGPSVDEALSSATSAFARGDQDGACSALLDAWRENQAPEIAEVLATLSRAIAASRPRIEGKPRELLAQWLKLEETARESDVGTLLDALTQGTSKDVGEKIERLAARKADPRIADALVAMIALPPFTSTGAGPMWTKLFAAMEWHPDARSIGRLHEVRFDQGKHGATAERFRERVPKLIEAIRASAKPRLLTDAQRATLATLASKTMSIERPRVLESRDDLYAAVWADPDADGPRAVLSDFLQEQGDPHGELIALQLATHGRALTKAESARINALSKDHWRRFLGPLSEVVQREGLVFERGFASAGNVAAAKSNAFTDESSRHPAWSTFRRIANPRTIEMVRLAREVLHGLDLLLDAAEVLPVEHLVAIVDTRPQGNLEPELLARIAACRSMPSLRSLRLFSSSDGTDAIARARFEGYAPLFDTPLGVQLRTFATCTIGGAETAGWLHGILLRPDLALEELILTEGQSTWVDATLGDAGFTFHFVPKTRSARVTRSEVNSERRPGEYADSLRDLDDVDWLVETLDAISPDAVRSIVIERIVGAPRRMSNGKLDGRPPPTDDDRARVRAALAKFEHGELLSVGG